MSLFFPPEIRTSGAHPERADFYIVASAVLHNFCCLEKDEMDLGNVEVPPEPEQPEPAAAPHGPNARAQTRDLMITYFADLPE